jgi:hypothetical protein
LEWRAESFELWWEVTEFSCSLKEEMTRFTDGCERREARKIPSAVAGKTERRIFEVSGGN